jgi:uncharacterized repeat protein (TIGR01451 family)
MRRRSSSRGSVLFTFPYHRAFAGAVARTPRSALAGLMGTTLLAVASPAAATGTAAGSVINNTATATYSLPGGGSGSVDSNTVSLTVDELLDVSVAWSDGGDVPVLPGATGRVLTYLVTNNGNGSEAFVLSARNALSGDDFDPSAYAIYLDTNADGDYDPGIDLAYVAGSNDPVLAADAPATVFIVSSIGAGAVDGSRAGLDLIATADTGSGTPGTTFAGQGTGGGNAVVGATGADGLDDGYYAVSAATVALVKSATVSEPFGGTTAVPGSTISYTLVATVSGSGSLANLAIGDAIPAGSTYKPGTITLEGAALTDLADADAGEISPSGVAVRLGTVPAGQARTVTFQVTIAN